MTPEQAAKDWTISDEPLTPERAALMAAHVFDMAADASHFPEQAAALVQVADGWTRLHTALANAPKTIQPAPSEPAELDTYHWMITFVVPTETGFDVRQRSGTCQPNGRTRSEMFEALAQEVMDSDGIAVHEFSVMFFGLEPNDIP